MNKRIARALLVLFCLQFLAGCVKTEVFVEASVPTAYAGGDVYANASASERAIIAFKTPSPRPEPTPLPDAADKGGLVPVTAQPTSDFAQLAPTTRMSFEELVGDNGNYEDVVGYPAPGTFKLIVDIYHQVVLAYKKDAKGEYTIPVRYMVCSSGSSKHPSPRGTYEAGKHRVRFGLFVNDNVYGQYWTQITRRIYFHSLLYSQRNAKTYTTSSYKNLGKRASHGCIRLLVPDARWVYYHVAPGTEVELRKGSKEDAATAAIKEKLTRPSLPKSRPSLKKGDIPHTDNWDIDTYLSNYSDVVYVKK